MGAVDGPASKNVLSAYSNSAPSPLKVAECPSPDSAFLSHMLSVSLLRVSFPPFQMASLQPSIRAELRCMGRLHRAEDTPVDASAKIRVLGPLFVLYFVPK